MVARPALEYHEPHGSTTNAMSCKHNGNDGSGLTRREALRSFANGFGMLGLAGLLATEQRAWGAARAGAAGRASPPFHAARQESHLPVHVWRPLARRPLRSEAAPDRRQRQAAAFEKPKLERAETGNLLGSPFQVRQVWPVGHGIQRTATQPRWLRQRYLHDSFHGGRQHQPQWRLPSDEHRRADVFTSEHGSWLASGLGSENQDLPGFVVLSPAQPAQGAPLWGFRLPARDLPGTLVSNSNTPIANLSNPGMTMATQRPARLAQPPQFAAPAGSRRRFPAERAHRVLRAGLPHADRRPPRRLTSRARARPRRSSMALASPQPTSSASSACWRGGW